MIVVTGGAGYVGSALMPLMLQSGLQVRCLDLVPAGVDHLLQCFRYSGFELVRCDVRRPELVAPLLRGADAIVHLAALVGYPACDRDPVLARETNLGASRAVNDCRDRDQFVVYASTGSVYGRVLDGECTEDTPAVPASLYGETKLEAEGYFLAKGNAAVLRLATAFGLAPKVRTDLLINSFCMAALRDRRLMLYEGHARRTFLHVHDIGRALLHALNRRDLVRDRVFNCGDASLNASKLDIANLLRRFLDIQVATDGEGEDLDRRDYLVNHGRWIATGYQPVVTLEDGIREMLAAFSFFPTQGSV